MHSINASRLSIILLLLCICVAAGCSRVHFQPRDKDVASPVRGGTLEILGTSDVDHLASTSAYLTTTAGLLRAFTRTLVTYPASVDFLPHSKYSARIREILTRCIFWPLRMQLHAVP